MKISPIVPGFAFMASQIGTYGSVHASFLIARDLTASQASSLITRDPGHTASSLITREPGTVAEWSGLDARAISLGLYTVNIGVLGSFTAISCMAAFAAPNPISGTICAASALATLGYLIASHWMVANKRGVHPLHLDGLVMTFNQIEGQTATQSMAQAYAASGSDEPILVAHHACSASGCYQYRYQNYIHPTLGLVHALSQEPRGERDNKVSRRNMEAYGAYEDSEKSKNGEVIYGTYTYLDTNPDDEMELGQIYSGQEIAEALYDTAVTEKIFTEQGYYCVDIIDHHNNDVPSTGFLDVTAGKHVTDPNETQKYLEMCYNDECRSEPCSTK